ncbi:MAG TPA: 16S rRNA (cytosine(967)-C(5))-methyltransferase RsmB [Verrucomicrobiae bacterium]
MTAEKPREIAVEVLLERAKGQFVEALLDSALKKHELKSEDRGFLQELVYGAVRWELTLDWLIEQKTDGKPQKEVVQNLLRLALYQMFWLERVPSYAVVNETVEICKGRGLQPQAKFVNAVLRGYDREAAITRERLEQLKATKPAIGYSHPEWLWRRWEKAFGFAGARKLMEWNNSPPPVFARVNTLRASVEEVRSAWEAEGVAVEEVKWDWVPKGLVYRFVTNTPIAKLGSFEKGFFYVQDPSTLLAPAMLDPQPGSSVLDVCAAPGGKTTYIAQLLKNEGRVVAQDIESARLRLVEENAARLGATCVETGKPLEQGEMFDRVLIDAPCSNTGVMRRRVELRWRIKPEEIKRLALTQINILREAAKRVKAGGVLVYSTCSLEREENQAVVGQFLGENNAFGLDGERELTPMKKGVDGAYCARLRRRG